MSIANEIKELAALHESGVLTDEEFKQAKEKLLTGNNEAASPSLDEENADASKKDTSATSADETSSATADTPESTPDKKPQMRRNILIAVLVIVIAVTAYIIFSDPVKKRSRGSSQTNRGSTSTSGKANIEPSCTVNGFGSGKCEFMNNGREEGKICIKASIKQKLGYRSSSTTTLCSGIVAPGDMRERSLVISMPRDLCKTESYQDSWTDVCSLNIEKD